MKKNKSKQNRYWGKLKNDKKTHPLGDALAMNFLQTSHSLLNKYISVYFVYFHVMVKKIKYTEQ